MGFSLPSVVWFYTYADISTTEECTVGAGPDTRASESVMVGLGLALAHNICGVMMTTRVQPTARREA